MVGSCSYLMSKLKPLKFKFSDKYVFSLPPSAYLIEGFELSVPGYCVFGVQGTAESTFNMYILGDIFLNSFYSVYDYDNKRVGIALHIQS